MASRLEDDLGFLIARTYRAMRRALMARLAPLGITYPQFQVLNALCQEDNVSQIALAGRVNMDKTSLARMLDRMERAGLIRRSVDPANSRANIVALTRKGQRLQAQALPLRRVVLNQAGQGLGEKEVAELKRCLNLIYDNLHDP
jgi:DNA-binding MarR family transcriptional regulator